MGSISDKAEKTKVNKKKPSRRFAKLRCFLEEMKITPDKRP